MEQQRLELDETSFNAVISYCEKTGEWEKALAIVSLRTQSQLRFYFLVRASYTFIIGWYA